MKRGRSTGNMTVPERAWVDAVKRCGCVFCIALGHPHSPDAYAVDAHHMLSGGIRRGHMFTVGGCIWHHRGRLFISGWNHKQHRMNLGPALSEGSVPFYARFGDDDAIMEQQLEILAKAGESAALRARDEWVAAHA